jgi:cytochrome c-type biogenesis protein CcsB
MTTRSVMLITILAALLAVAPTRTAPGQAATAPEEPPASQPAVDPDAFADAVDLETIGRFAVHTEGRVKSLDSFARGMMRFITGPRRIDERSHTFTLLDIAFHPEGYSERDVIFVKNKLLRSEIVRAVEDRVDADRARRMMKEGLIAPDLIADPRAQAVLERASTDLIKTARFVDMVRTAMQLMDPVILRRNLRIVAPPGGGVDDAWLAIDEVAFAGPADPRTAAFDDDVRRELASEWITLTAAWKDRDAASVNAAAARLAELLPQVNTDPTVYPATSRLAWESWYFQAPWWAGGPNMTGVWVYYALSLVPLLLYVVFRWSGARVLGLLMFFGAFGFHTFAVMLRWYVSGRWPNSNMFEAVTTAAWFGGCFAVLFEVFAQRSPLRGLVAIASAASSMVALMCAYYLPLSLDPNIGNMMPVLHDLWLYIHTNVIIFSYCLIFMAAVSAVLYLGYRGLGALGLRDMDGTKEHATVGGAGSLMMKTPEGEPYLARGRTTLGQVLDGSTMVLLELSFVLLWAGIVMGAIWADHSWGRPWGWDPKEVFALNTFLIFAVLVHTRFKVRDKGLWTAVLAVIGCIVMLFNWIVINFTIAGLHSYA